MLGDAGLFMLLTRNVEKDIVINFIVVAVNLYTERIRIMTPSDLDVI